ncbi:MAG: (Fe-S)-binding protein [Candidatus Bathyarchaeia archaeon]
MPKEFIWPRTRTCLEDYYDMLQRCNKCGLCKNLWPANTYSWKFGYQCPSGEEFLFEHYYATGRMEMAIAVVEEKIDVRASDFKHALFTCTSCGSCEATAEMTCTLTPLRIIEELKVKTVEKGGILPEHVKLMENCIANNNIYNEPHEARFVWFPKDLNVPQKARNIYFVGDTTCYRRPEIAIATIKILRKLGLDFGILGEKEHCCGDVFLRTGNVEFGRKLLERSIQQLNELKVETVIFSDPHCYRAFREAEKYDLNIDFECISISELIESSLPKLSFKRLEKKLTYHDPCQLGRALGIYEPPRNILKAIPGIELVEMPRSRRLSFCCGAGGGVIHTYPELAAKTAMRRLEEATDCVDGAGVKTIVTNCPLCKYNLQNVASEFMVEVKDLTEIVLEALN